MIVLASATKRAALMGSRIEAVSMRWWAICACWEGVGLAVPMESSW